MFISWLNSCQQFSNKLYFLEKRANSANRLHRAIEINVNVTVTT